MGWSPRLASGSAGLQRVSRRLSEYRSIRARWRSSGVWCASLGGRGRLPPLAVARVARMAGPVHPFQAGLRSVCVVGSAFETLEVQQWGLSRARRLAPTRDKKLFQLTFQTSVGGSTAAARRPSRKCWPSRPGRRRTYGPKSFRATPGEGELELGLRRRAVQSVAEVNALRMAATGAEPRAPGGRAAQAVAGGASEQEARPARRDLARRGPMQRQ